MSELIRIANLLPPEFYLPDLKYGSKFAFEDKITWTRNARQEIFARHNDNPSQTDFWYYVFDGVYPKTYGLRRRFVKFKHGRRRFVRLNSFEGFFHLPQNINFRVWHDTFKMTERFEAFIEIRRKLKQLAKTAVTFRGRDLNFIENVRFRLNSDGFVEMQPNPIATALAEFQAGQLTLDRVRLCPICNRIYFAGRSDKQACSDKCQNVNNVRAKRGKAKRAKMIDPIQRRLYNSAKRKKRLKAKQNEG